MVQYAEDQFSCRRQLQLEYFGEKIDKSICKKTCDNCKNGNKFMEKDVTLKAKEIIQLFLNRTIQKKTFLQLIDFLRKKLKNNNF